MNIMLNHRWKKVCLAVEKNIFCKNICKMFISLRNFYHSVSYM